MRVLQRLGLLRGYRLLGQRHRPLDRAGGEPRHYFVHRPHARIRAEPAADRKAVLFDEQSQRWISAADACLPEVGEFDELRERTRRPTRGGPLLRGHSFRGRRRGGLRRLDDRADGRGRDRCALGVAGDAGSQRLALAARRYLRRERA